MLESLATVLLGTFVLGLAVWHIARVVVVGEIFEPMRQGLAGWGQNPDDDLPEPGLRGFVFRTSTCRLCFGTQAAILVTWGALITLLVADWNQEVLPLAYWVFAFVVGPFVTAAWSELIRWVAQE